MKLFLRFLLINLVVTNAHCQDQASIAFLHNFFGQSAKITYMDKLWEYQIKRLQRATAQDTLSDISVARSTNPDDQLILTQQERNHIQRELKLLADVTWTKQLFENGKILNQATLDSIDNNRAQGEAYFRKHYGPTLYSFSKPIFIREHSLCFFYSGYSCGSRCGEGQLIVYKKQNTGWTPWLNLYKWVS